MTIFLCMLMSLVVLTACMDESTRRLPWYTTLALGFAMLAYLSHVGWRP